MSLVYQPKFLINISLFWSYYRIIYFSLFLTHATKSWTIATAFLRSTKKVSASSWGARIKGKFRSCFVKPTGRFRTGLASTVRFRGYWESFSRIHSCLTQCFLECKVISVGETGFQGAKQHFWGPKQGKLSSLGLGLKCWAKSQFGVFGASQCK